MSTRSTSVASAQVIISDAFERFKATVSAEDIVLLGSATVKDVIDAMVAIQQDLRDRRENRNLRKLYPFLEGLRNYGQIMDSLSNGLSPFMPWVWAPIKLALQVTSDHLSAFDKLIEAYGRISDTLPRLEKIGEAFKDNGVILTKLALYYADILDFHRRTYKFIRRKSWKYFFMTTWSQFDVRFHAILDSMAYHSDLIAQEATAIDIFEAKIWREKFIAESKQKEKDRNEKQRLSVISWLTAKPISQEDECERLLRDYLPGSCNWVDDVFKDWYESDEQHPIVWLDGKPGAGKSVLCASLLQKVEERRLPTVFYFCKYRSDDTVSEVLKSVIIQLIAKDSDLAALVYTEYVLKNTTPSLKCLRAITIGNNDRKGIFSSLPICRIVIDGLDECNGEEQGLIIEALTQLISVGRSASHDCKLLLSSRNILSISRTLQRGAWKPLRVSLSREYVYVNTAIRDFITTRLGNLNEDHPALQLDTAMKEELSLIMVDKADGMFLWAKLVLDSISDIDSIAELHEAVIKMPKQLPELYKLITDRLYSQIPTHQTKISRIFAWLVFAKRPLRKSEVLHGVTITPETPSLSLWNRLHDTAIDKCRPLIEELPDGTISFVHSTVKEYFMTTCAIDQFKPSTWRETIAFACISILEDGLGLLDTQTQSSAQFERIITGRYALLPYCIDFWIEHLLDCTRDHRPGPQSTIMNALGRLELTHERLLRELRGSVDKRTVLQQDDPRLQAITHLPAASICFSLLNFRKKCRKQSTENGAVFEKFTRNSDPTLSSELSEKYDHLVKQLLSGVDLPDTLSKTQVELFRRQYISCSFRCRFSPCTKTSLGFVSESARTAHEQLHANCLFCDKRGCIGARTIFKTQQQLNRHNKACHENGSILVPARVRGLSSMRREQNRDGPADKTSRFNSSSNNNTNSLASPKPEQFGQLEKQDYLSSVRYNATSQTIKINILFECASRVDCVRISPDGQSVAIGQRNTICIYDILTGAKQHELTIEDPSDSTVVRAVAFDPDNQYLTAGFGDGVLKAWHIKTEAISQLLSTSGPAISAVEFSPDGKKIVAAGESGNIRVWDFMESGLKSDSQCLPPEYWTWTSEGFVSCISISPDNLYLVSRNINGDAYIWKMESGAKAISLRTSSFLNDSVLDVSFLLDGTLTTVTARGRLQVWGSEQLEQFLVPTKKPIRSTIIEGQRWLSHLECAANTPDGRYIVWGDWYHSEISFSETMTGSVWKTFEPHDDPTKYLDISKRMERIVTASDCMVRVWSYSIV